MTPTHEYIVGRPPADRSKLGTRQQRALSWVEKGRTDPRTIGALMGLKTQECRRVLDSLVVSGVLRREPVFP